MSDVRFRHALRKWRESGSPDDAEQLAVEAERAGVFGERPDVPADELLAKELGSRPVGSGQEERRLAEAWIKTAGTCAASADQWRQRALTAERALAEGGRIESPSADRAATGYVTINANEEVVLEAVGHTIPFMAFDTRGPSHCGQVFDGVGVTYLKSPDGPPVSCYVVSRAALEAALAEINRRWDERGDLRKSLDEHKATAEAAWARFCVPDCVPDHEER